MSACFIKFVPLRVAHPSTPNAPIYRSFGILFEVCMGSFRSFEVLEERVELAAGLNGADFDGFFINCLYVPSKYIFTARSRSFPQLLLIAERISAEILSPMKASNVS